MRRLTPILAAVLFLTPPADAQPQRTPPEERNAALKYWAAWAMMGREPSLVIAEIDWNQPGVPEGLGEKMEESEPAIRHLIEASRLQRCDFEIEYEKGIDTLLPHLQRAREGSRVLRASARLKLAAGEVDAAAERLAAIYRLSGHVAQDDVLISSLVSIAIAKFADAEVEALLTSGALTATGRDTLLDGMSRLSGPDPFHAKAAIAGERDLTIPWVKQATKGDDAGERLATLVGAMGEAADNVRRMNGEQIAKATSGLSRYYDDVVAAWDAQDSVARLTALGDDLSGKYGPLAGVLSAAFGKARQSDLDAQAALAKTRAAVKAAKVK